MLSLKPEIFAVELLRDQKSLKAKILVVCLVL